MNNFQTRKELTDDEVLKKGDRIWMHGNWKQIPESHIGLKVEIAGSTHGVSPRPTYGRLKDSR